MSKVNSGSLRLSGNAFQTDGLATENARQPNVFRRHRGTITLLLNARVCIQCSFRIASQLCELCLAFYYCVEKCSDLTDATTKLL